MKLQLTSAQRSALRARAHALHPVVMIADAGLSERVMNEIERSLAAHELIKIRVFEADRDVRAAMLEEISDTLNAAPVQHLGKILVVYRPQPEEAQKKAAPLRPRRKLPRRTKRSFQH